jgi:hypothetical protein
MSGHDERPTPQLASEYGRRKIAELKERHPSRSAWIDDRVREYLEDDSIPPADDELVLRLRDVLEPPGGPTGKDRSGGRGRGGSGRRNRR